MPRDLLGKASLGILGLGLGASTLYMLDMARKGINPFRRTSGRKPSKALRRKVNKAYRELGGRGEIKKIREANHYFNSGYNLYDGTVVAPKDNEFALYHEVAHATSPFKNYIKYLYHPSLLATVAIMPHLTVEAIKRGVKGKNLYGPGLLSLAISSPALIEEGQANFRAFRALAKKKGLLKTIKESFPYLVGSYSTYLSIPAMALGAGYLAKRFPSKFARIK